MIEETPVIDDVSVSSREEQDAGIHESMTCVKFTEEEMRSATSD